MEIERPIVTQSPENSETPLSEMRSWVTPNAFFFVRNHFAEPDLTSAGWRLQVQGQVRRPRTWTAKELTDLPERTVFATLECAGNGRSFLRQPEPGVQWGAGAVGHAEWTGVPLATVLEVLQSVKRSALEVLCQGTDIGTEPDHPEQMHFVRGLPLAKAMHPDTLLAFRMNGEPLTRSHGAPVRLIVPGWYGVCSVKWIARLELLDYQYEGYFQSEKYTIRRREDGKDRKVRLTRMAVKSQIIRPCAGSELRPGVNRISGIAWAGEEAVAKVEVSTDGGLSWCQASLVGPRAPYSWTPNMPPEQPYMNNVRRRHGGRNSTGRARYSSWRLCDQLYSPSPGACRVAGTSSGFLGRLGFTSRRDGSGGRRIVAQAARCRYGLCVY